MTAPPKARGEPATGEEGKQAPKCEKMPDSIPPKPPP